MRLTKLLGTIENGVCQAIIPYICKNICFGVLEKNKGVDAVWTWYSCRDVFHGDFPESNHIFIYHKGHSFTKLKKFLGNLEDQLQIDDKSTVFKTVRKSASLIILSEFWHDNMNFSLLTILLRYGIDYKKTNFNIKDTIKCKMLKETMEALKYFFEGHTEYIGDKSGWHEQFADLSVEEVGKYLR